MCCCVKAIGARDTPPPGSTTEKAKGLAYLGTSTWIPSFTPKGSVDVNVGPMPPPNVPKKLHKKLGDLAILLDFLVCGVFLFGYLCFFFI